MSPFHRLGRLSVTSPCGFVCWSPRLRASGLSALTIAIVSRHRHHTIGVYDGPRFVILQGATPGVRL